MRCWPATCPGSLAHERAKAPKGAPEASEWPIDEWPIDERARPALGPGIGQPAAAAGLGDRPDRAPGPVRRAEFTIVAAGREGHHDRARGRARAGFGAVRAAAR